MIRDDLDPWTRPNLFFYYEDDFTEDFLGRLCDTLTTWGPVRLANDRSTLTESLAADRSITLAEGTAGSPFTVSMKQPGEGIMDHLAELSVRDVQVSGLDGNAWFEFVVGLYERSVEVGRRPCYAIVTPNSGDYYIRPFTEESIRSGEIFEIGWIHVFTPRQVETVGRDRLETAPATRVDPLDDGSVVLALTLGDGDERERVADHVGIAGPVYDDWFEDLQHEVDYVRRRAARRIERLAGEEPDIDERILDHLDHRVVEDPSVRFTLTRALHRVRGDDVDAILRRLAASDPSEGVRSMALGVIGDVESVRVGLWDDSPRVQYSALQGLYTCPDEAALERTVALLDSEYTLTRHEAAERLTSSAYVRDLPDASVESARRALADRFEHEDPTIRRFATEAAAALAADGAIDPTEYADRLAAGLEDDVPFVRIAAAERWPDVGENLDPAIDCLLSIIDDESRYTDSAAESVVTLDQQRANLELVPRLGDFEAHVEGRIVRLLDDSIEERGTDWARSTLREIDPAERAAAASVLEESEDGERLRELLEGI